MIRILALRLYRTELRTRMPFNYGIASMIDLPHVFLVATVEIDGAEQEGIAADNLPPKWFTKDPARNVADEIDEMLLVIRQAMQHAASIIASSAFTFWNELYLIQSAWGKVNKLPALLANLGTSLIERAILDAFARHHRAPLHRLLREDALGLDLGVIHPELANSRTRDWLPSAPLTNVFARHTIGLADPFTAADIAAGAKLDDGLPQSLEDCIKNYGLRHFKVKINGGRAADLERIERLADLLSCHAPADYAFSLDGNENFKSIEAFREFWDEMAARPTLAEFTRHLLFVEQPFHRDIALTETFGELARVWPTRPPIIIDESDAAIGDLASALRLGYAGTSHKNCKGVFKGIANGCRLTQLQRAQPQFGFVMSGEDLANIGPIALQQDLAIQALLGIGSVERNGHHYFAGLSFWPADWQAAILEMHADLYNRSARGWPSVNLRDGKIALGSINASPFGTAFLPDLARLNCIAAN